MKIALITQYWKNSKGGGIKTFVVNLVQVLKDKGINVSVVFREGNDPEQFYGGRNKFGFSLTCYMQLQRIRPDVIHTQGTWYCLLPGVIYKKFHKCRLIHTFHGEPDKRLPLFATFFFQSLLNNCDYVTFVSKKLKERIEEINGFSFQKTQISYAGVAACEITDDQIKQFRDRFGIKRDALVLLTQGMTAHPLKAEGLKILIQAVRILRDAYPKIILVVTRGGDYLKMVKEFTKEIDVEKNVVFTGDLENPFIPLKACEIYAHITLADGMPLSLLEAMITRKPIIATPIGGIPEALENDVSGILVEPDPKKIADKISFLLQNPEICDIITRNAQFKAEKNFTWENSATTFISLYRGEY